MAKKITLVQGGALQDAHHAFPDERPPTGVDEEGYPITNVETATYRTIPEEFARLQAQGIINQQARVAGLDRVSPELEEAFLAGDLELMAQLVVHDRVDIAEADRRAKMAMKLRAEAITAQNAEEEAHSGPSAAAQDEGGVKTPPPSEDEATPE